MNAEPESVEPELRDYLAVLRRRWVLVVAALALVVGVVLALSLTQTSMYRAEAEVLVRQTQSTAVLDGVTATGTERSLANELRLAEATSIVDAARGEIGDDPGLSVRADANADVLVFSATSSDPERAAAAADAYANAFAAQRRQGIVDEYVESGDVLQQQVDDIDAELAALAEERTAEIAAVPGDDPARDARIARIDADHDRQEAALESQRQRYTELLDSLLVSAELAQGSGTQVIKPAEVPESPYEPTVVRNLVLALMVGLVLGVGAAFLFEYLDTSLRGDEDLQAAAGGAATLAIVPELDGWKPRDRPHVITREAPQSNAAEAYRGLRTSVQFLSIDRTIRSVALTSPRPGDGKTTTSTNLAVASARAGQRVVLVDCDLRKPRVHEFFDLPNDRGFTTVLLGEARLEDVAQKVDGEQGLVVITSGPVPPDPSELLAGKRARSLISQIADQADLVVIDAPPVLAVADPLIVAGMVDGVILVASAGGTDRAQVTRSVEQLRLVDAPLLGTVLNRFSGGSTGAYGYGYGTYGSYGGPAAPPPRRTAPTPELHSDLPSPNGWEAEEPAPVDRPS